MGQPGLRPISPPPQPPYRLVAPDNATQPSYYILLHQAKHQPTLRAMPDPSAFCRRPPNVLPNTWVWWQVRQYVTPLGPLSRRQVALAAGVDLADFGRWLEGTHQFRAAPLRRLRRWANARSLAQGS